MNRSRITGDLTASGLLYADIANDRVGIGSTIPGNKLSLPDGAKIGLGNAEDLTLYHQSGANFIRNNSSQIIHLMTDASIRFNSVTGSENILIGEANGAVKIYFNNSKKIETTDTGAVVTGILTATSFVGGLPITSGADNRVITASSATAIQGESNLTFDGSNLNVVDGGAIIGGSTDADVLVRLDHEDNTGKAELQLNAWGSASISLISNFSGSTYQGVENGSFGLSSAHARDINFVTAGSERFRIRSGGDVQVMTKLGIGITPNRLLTLYGDTGLALQNSTTGTGNSNGTHIWVNDQNNGELLIQNREASDIEIYTSDTERLRITSTGVVSINDSTPETWATLQVKNHTGANAAAVLIHGADMAQIMLRDETGGTNTKITTLRNDQGALLIGTHNDAYGGFAHKYRITTAGTHVFGGNTAAPIVDNGELLYRGNSTQTFESLPQSFYLYGDSLGSGSANAGTGMVFGGNYKTDGTQTTFAGIHGIKENTTNDEYGGALVFGVRQNGSSSWERMRITAGGCVYASNFGFGQDDRWKIRPNTSNTELAFEYSTSSTLADTNIKAFFRAGGSFVIKSDPLSAGGTMGDRGLIFQANSTPTDGQVIQGITFCPHSTQIGRARAGIAGVANANGGSHPQSGSDLVFLTRYSADGHDLDVTTDERLRITSDGQIFIGGNTGYNESSALISFATDSSAGANMLSDSSAIYNHNNPAFIHVQNRYNTGTGQEAGIIFHSRSSHNGSWAIYGKRTSSSYLSDLIFRNRTASAASAERLRIQSDGRTAINIDDARFGQGNSASGNKFYQNIPKLGVQGSIVIGNLSSTATDVRELAFYRRAGSTAGSAISTHHMGRIAWYGSSNDSSFPDMAWSIECNPNGNGWTAGSNRHGYLSFISGRNGQYMRLNSSGYLGVGHAGNPSTRLHVQGNSDGGAESATLTIEDTDGTAGSREPILAFDGNGTRQGRIMSHDTNGMYFGTGSSNNTVIQLTDKRDLYIHANARAWSTTQLGNIRYHCRQHYSPGNAVQTQSLMRVKRYWWGWGTYKITAKMHYYGAGSHEATFFLNGHGNNDSYSIVKLKEELTNGGDNYYGGSGLISITSPSNSSPGNSTTSFVDVQINIPNYTYAIIIIEAMSSQYGEDPTNMGNNEYVLL